MGVKLGGYLCDYCRVFWDFALHRKMLMVNLGRFTCCFCSDKCKDKFYEEKKEQELLSDR